MASQSEVFLTVPAMPEFLRVARVTASGLASRVGFSIDEVDDLRLALDELCFALIGKGDDENELRLRYTLLASGLKIEGSTERADAEPLAVGEFSRQILTALVDEHEVWNEDGEARFSLAKTKPAGAR